MLIFNVGQAKYEENVVKINWKSFEVYENLFS